MTTISEIAEASRSVKKATNKGMAFEAVQTVARALTDQQREDLWRELARLYAAFRPALPKKPKSNFEWCAKAAGWKDVRESLSYVHVTEERMVGTDGYRVHMAPNNDSLEPGYYDAAGVKIHDLSHSRYPDIERVMVSDLRANGREIIESKLSDLESGSFIDGNNKIWHYCRFPNETNVNMQYMSAAVSMETDAVIQWSVGSPNDVVALELPGGRRAVLMPMRVDNAKQSD